MSLWIMSLRREVIAFYREVLRLSRSWNARNDKDTVRERTYIREEARNLFKANKHVNDENVIRKLLEDGKNRVEIANHYGIPFPRPIYFKKGVIPKIRKKQSPTDLPKT